MLLSAKGKGDICRGTRKYMILKFISQTVPCHLSEREFFYGLKQSLENYLSQTFTLLTFLLTTKFS